MRAHRVVPDTEIFQQIVQCIAGIDFELIELLFQRAEQALDTPIHPRATRRAELLLDTCDAASPAEDPAAKDARVVRAERTRHAISTDGDEHMPQECPRILALERVQGEELAAAVVDDAEDGMVVAKGVPLARHVDGPCVVDRYGSGRATFDVAAQQLDLVAMFAERVAHERFADRHAVADGMDAVEELFDGTTSLTGQCGQAKDFLYHPGRFGVGAADGFFLSDASGLEPFDLPAM